LLLDIVTGMLDACDTDMELLNDALAGTGAAADSGSAEVPAGTVATTLAGCDVLLESDTLRLAAAVAGIEAELLTEIAADSDLLLDAVIGTVPGMVTETVWDMEATTLLVANRGAKNSFQVEGIVSRCGAKVEYVWLMLTMVLADVLPATVMGASGVPAGTEAGTLLLADTVADDEALSTVLGEMGGISDASVGVATGRLSLSILGMLEANEIWLAAPVAGTEKETLSVTASESDLLLDIVAGMLDASDRDMELLCDALAET
jgi:HSP20 family molecular chaperone IbpA